MSEVDKLRDTSLSIMWISLGIVFVVFAIGAAIAMINNPQITIKGEIDLGQFTGIIIGIAMVAVTLVAQKLTATTQAAAVKATDDVWLSETKP